MNSIVLKIKYLFFILIGFICSAQSETTVSDSLVEHQVDSLMSQAIQAQAFPGAQLLVAHQNEVIFRKAYGFHTYDSIQSVSLTDVYDLASVTKILGPLPVLMKLVDEGVLDLDAPFSTYWKPWQKQKDKK